MAQNELVHRGSEVSPHVCGDAVTEGFKVFRMPRSDRGVARGPRKVEKPVKAGKRSPGRPRVYNGTQRRIVAAALRHYGYTKGLEFLRKERALEVSMTLARDVAREVGITFKRGRPAA
jgi:transposase